jgi:putative transposase
MEYLRTLRQIIQSRGSDHIVYLDESGFERTAHRTHGWGPRGKKIHGIRSSRSRPRTSLLSAKRGKTLLAPILFEGSTNATLFNYWLKSHLFAELAQNSMIIMDNAAFHKTPLTRQLIRDAGHSLLFLPPYSPDFNPIEQDFAIMKRRRQFLPAETAIDEVVRSHVNYLD